MKILLPLPPVLTFTLSLLPDKYLIGNSQRKGPVGRTRTRLQVHNKID
jgi:hypothetical protein